jgi:hypothetical protein
MGNVKLKVLASLALMETDVLSRDYLSNFLPYIANLIAKKDYVTIEIREIVKDFAEEYGIDLPHAPMKDVLSRAVEEGIIVLEQNGKYVAQKRLLSKYSFLTARTMREQEINILLNNFISFVKEKYNLDIDRAKAGENFIDFLDEYSPKAIAQEDTLICNETGKSNKNNFLMAEFIQHCRDNNFDAFDLLNKLSVAYLLTVALNFDEPVGRRIERFKGVTIYLDTPIILRLLGLQTEELALSYKEMFDNFTETIEPEFRVFQHTYNELEDIISDCIKWIDDPLYDPRYANPALLQFMKKSFTKIEIELYAASLADKLNKFNIGVDTREYYLLQDNIYEIDVAELKKILVSTYQKNNPEYDDIKGDRALTYDIKSIENIAKLWGGKSSRSYNNLGYVFLTTNSTLSFVSRHYIKKYWWNKQQRTSPCITDSYLGTMVWLSTPAEKMEKLSRLKLLADCSAATSLSKEILDKLYKTVEEMKKSNKINNEDYLILRAEAYESNNYLKRITYNDKNEFSDETVEQLLEYIKRGYVLPYKKQIDEKNDENIRLKEELEEATRKNLEFLADKQTEEKRQYKYEEKIDKRAKIFCGKIADAFPIAIAFFTLFGAMLVFVPDFQNLRDKLGLLIAALMVISAILAFMWKRNAFSIKNKIINVIKKIYRTKLLWGERL